MNEPSCFNLSDRQVSTNCATHTGHKNELVGLKKAKKCQKLNSWEFHTELMHTSIKYIPDRFEFPSSNNSRLFLCGISYVSSPEWPRPHVRTVRDLGPGIFLPCVRWVRFDFLKLWKMQFVLSIWNNIWKRNVSTKPFLVGPNHFYNSDIVIMNSHFYSINNRLLWIPCTGIILFFS